MLRNLLLFLLMIPGFLPAQHASPSVDLSKANSLEDQHFRARLLRVGLTSKVDKMPGFDHRWVGNDLVPWRSRGPLFAAALDWQPLRKIPHLLVVMEVGYQKNEYLVTSDQVKVFRSNLRTSDFRENIAYRRWQISPGLRLDLLPKYAASPFVSMKMLLAIPTRMLYQFKSTDPSNLSIPLQVDIDGGAEVSPGWEFSVGLRVQLAEVFHLSLAFYHMELDQKVNWPMLDFRDIGDTILSFKNQGFLLSLQYEL